MKRKEELIVKFSEWLQEQENCSKETANRVSWDFVAGTYSTGDTLEGFQDAWVELEELEV